MTGLLVFLVVVVLGVAGTVAVARRTAEQRWAAARTADLLVGPTGVRRELVDGRVEEVRWDEVAEVEIVLADRGPHAESGGVVVLYGSAARGVLVPLDRLGPSGLLEGMARLPGFRVELLTAALEERPPARTTCWRAG